MLVLLALVFVGALFISVTLLPVLMQNAERWHLVDVPNEKRKIHKVSKPRVGGLGIVAAAFLSATYWLVGHEVPPGLVVGAVTIVVFGYLDDRHNLRVRWKLFGQILAALALLMGGTVIPHVPFLPLDVALPWLTWPLTFVFVLGAINAVNLSDGLDGLAGGMALMSLCLIAALGLSGGQYLAPVIATAVGGGLMGFLRYNTHPSQMFMGDTGSQFLGYVIAALAILLVQEPGLPVSPMLPLLIVGMPVLDTAAVMMLRILKGRSPFLPDSSHLHHQLIDVGLSHHQAVAMLYALQFLLLALAWGYRFAMEWKVVLFYGAFTLIVLGPVAVLRLTSTALVHRQEGTVERRNQLLRRLGWVYLHSSRIIASGLGLLLVVAAFLVRRPVEGLGHTPLLAAFTGAMVWAIFRERREFVVRLLVYMACAFVVYAISESAARPVFTLGFDVVLVLMVAFLFLAIRMTRREVFRPDTQDALVVLMILIIPLLPFGPMAEIELQRIALRSAALLYCCEFVLSRSPGARHFTLNTAAIAALLVLGV